MAGISQLSSLGFGNDAVVERSFLRHVSGIA